MHGDCRGDDDEVAAAAAAIQHEIMVQNMLQFSTKYSAALKCDVAHLPKVLGYCMRNQAACYAYVQEGVPWEVEVCERRCYQILDAVLPRNRVGELDRDANAHLHGLGICQTPYDAENYHPADAHPDVDLHNYLYVNVGGIFTAGHNVNDRYKTKRLYTHGSMVVREFVCVCMRPFAWLVEVAGLQALHKSAAQDPAVQLEKLGHHTEQCCLKNLSQDQSTSAACGRVCRAASEVYQRFGFVEVEMAAERLEACRTAAEKEPQLKTKRSDLKPPKVAEVSYFRLLWFAF
jgi:hypothetical protein